jgi:hypothetical protein
MCYQIRVLKWNKVDYAKILCPVDVWEEYEFNSVLKFAYVIYILKYTAQVGLPTKWLVFL